MSTYSKENKNRIKQLAQNLRFKHDAMDWTATPDFFIRKEGLDYCEYNLQESSLIKKITKPIRTLAKIIKAALVVKEQVILIDEDLHSKQKPFGKAHELGHHAIPEHKAIFYICSEHDLNLQTVIELEFEANLFASELLFPQHLLDSIYEDYPTSMETILQLANLSKASFHAAAIKYANESDRVCCLLILKVDRDKEGKKGLILKQQIASNSWWRRYKHLIASSQFLPQKHVLSKIVFLNNNGNIQKDNIRVGEHKFRVDTFYNQYSVLALLYEE